MATKEEYDEEPIYYCRECLSIKINGELEGCDYCEDCGSTNIESCNIFEWEAMYKKRKGKTFLEE